MEEQNWKCLECGSNIQGRTDKKFCCLSCKNSYHARLRRKRRQISNRIVNILFGNYRILDRMLENGRTSAPIEELACMGFVPSCITGCKKGRNNHDEYYCFDIRYYQSPTRVINIHRTDYNSLLSVEDDTEHL